MQIHTTTLIENMSSAYATHKWVRLATWSGLLLVALALFILAGGFPPHSWLLLAQVVPKMSSLLALHGLAVLPALLGLILLAFTLLVAWGGLILVFVRIVLYEWRERQELHRFNEDMAEAQHLAQTVEPLASPVAVNAALHGYAPNPGMARRSSSPSYTFPAGQLARKEGRSYAGPPRASARPTVQLPRREEPTYTYAGAPRANTLLPSKGASPSVWSERRSQPDVGREEEEQDFWEPDTEADMEAVMDSWMDTEDEDEPNIAEMPTAVHTRGVSATPPPASREQPVPKAAVASAYSPGDMFEWAERVHVRPLDRQARDSGNGVVGRRRRTDAPTEEEAIVQQVADVSRREVSPVPMRAGSRALRNSGRLAPISPINAAPSYADPQRVSALPTAHLPTGEVPQVSRPARSGPSDRAPSGHNEQVSYAAISEPVQRLPHPLATTFYGERNPMYPVAAPDYALQALTAVDPVNSAPGGYALHEGVEEEEEALQLIVSTGLETGIRRRGKPNEDNLLALQNTRAFKDGPCPIGLFVVADGMGGHENGQEASRLVIHSLSESVVPAILYGPADDVYPELLAEGVHRANLAIYQRNREQKADMGTTITAALVVNLTAYIVNAGDSRVYLYRNATGLTQVTRDHSTVARLVETGAITPEEVYTHPRRNEIYRCLGRHPTEEFDKFTLALSPGDLLLLCSDGLWEMVHDKEIGEIIQSTLPYPTQISSALVQAALNRGGKDNISVVVVYLKGK